MGLSELLHCQRQVQMPDRDARNILQTFSLRIDWKGFSLLSHYFCLPLPTLSQQSIGMVFHYFSLPLPTFAYFFSECYSASVRVFNNFQA